MTTTIKHIARSILPPYAGRAGVGLLLFLLLTVGANRAWAQIGSIPYSTDFSSSITPFEKTSGTTVEANSTNASIGSVLHVYNAVATATFTGGYTLKSTEQVSISFTAYHGWNSYNRTSKVAIKNTAGDELVSYTYNQNSTLVSDVSFGGNTVDGFEAFSGISKYDATKNANGIGGNGKPYVSTAGYNPTITMTICGNGIVTFRFVCAGQSIEQSFAATLSDKTMNLGSIVITDADTHSGDQNDRSICIDNLNITSQLYSFDYESTGSMSDWVTGTGGRYTPTIMDDGAGNHFMAVAQDQRHNNGATLTNSSIKGSAAAGEDFTLSFDMKIGRATQNGNNGQPDAAFTVYDASNTALFSLTDKRNSTDWYLDVAGAAQGTITLDGTGSNQALSDLTWYHVKLSYTTVDGTKLLYVTISSLDGTATYWRGGYTTSSNGGLSKMTFVTSRYDANFAFDNLKVSTFATTAFSVSGKTETYAITGEGDLRQKEEGSTITLEYGATYETQQTKTSGSNIGAYCAYKGNSDTNTYSTAWTTSSATNVAPGGGTFYKFTPKFNGTLSVLGGVEDADGGTLNKIILRNAVGSVKEEKTGSAGGNFAFSTVLQADVDYYLYAATPETGDYDSGKGSKATFFLQSFTFEQSAMNREIKVSDLLYTGSTGAAGGALGRTIPGFTLSYGDNNHVQTTTDGKSLTISSGGSLTVALRQNSHSATISSVTLNVSEVTSATINSNSITTTGKHSFTPGSSTDNFTLSCTAGSLTITSIQVEYNSSDAGSEASWLLDTKTTPSFSFATTHIMRVPGDGQAFTNTPTVSSPNSFNATYTYTSDNTPVATINNDGTNGQLLKSGSATITATFEETNYFAESTANYTVDNVLHTGGETYTLNHGHSSYTLRIDAKAADAASDLTLTGATDATLNFGTTTEKKLTSTNATSLTVTNSSAHNITIESLRVYRKFPVAWLYYEGQENNYSEQVHFQDFASGDVKGFRVLDIGDPIEPIDLTSAYSLKEEADYVWTDGSHVTAINHGGTFSTDKGSFTVGGKSPVDELNPETLLPKVTHLLTKTSTDSKYDDYALELTATANIFIATPTDEDGDAENDTYKVWDLTASVTGSGQMDSRWSWNGNGHFYQTSLPEYLPILNNTGTTLAGNEGLLVKGDMRYHTGTNGLRLNLTKANASLKFPVKAGMEVKVVMASSSADMTHVIKNETDLMGVPTEKLYIENPGVNAPVTAYYLAESDGAIEILSMDRSGAYVKSVTLQVPQIHFEEEMVVVKNEVADITNVPYNTGDATLTYSIGGSYNLNGTAAGSALATIADANVGKVSVASTNEGYVVVNVTNPSATGVQPKKGSYRLYMIDFRFNPTAYNKDTDADESGSADFPSLDLSSAAAKANNGEAVFDKLPTGYDKVISPVNYTMSVVSGSPRGRLTQTTNSDPKLTTYQLTAYSPGTIRVTATTGRITTYCDVTISGGDNLYAEMAPVRLLEDLPTEAATHYFTMALPTGLNQSYTSYTVDVSGDVTCDGATTTSEVIDEVTYYYTKISNIAGNGGAIRVTATDNNNTPGDNTDDKVAQFVLTIPYSASTGQKWDFYRIKHVSSGSQYGLYIGNIDEYDGDDNQTSTKPVSSHSATQHWDGSAWNSAWTTTTDWTKIFRKGKEQPRWAYTHSMRGYNAFVIEETAGLIVETGPKGFYTDNPHQPTEWAYNHIGLHNNASVTIPKLKAGDFIALNLARVTSNNGALLSVSNVKDLSGTTVDHTFSISRSQDDYSDGGSPAKDDSGARFIPGYYTFQAAADGDVTITLADEGYLDILSIEIYNNGYSAYSSTRDSKTGYNYTMKDIVTDGTYTTPPATFLMDTGDQEEVNLALCHYMWSTGVGPADYVLEDQIGNLDATLENVEWTSDGGATYNKGKIMVNDGYGKMLVRMNNYTAEGRYLIGYTPTYALTVGRKPHQDYPYTWNFENISGGAVKGKGNNAYNNISSDPYTWTGLGYETYQLDTRTSGGSLYVPGATLVTADRSLGEKGTIAELNAANQGCDEFNGLGFTGQIAFKAAQQGTEANDAPTGEWPQGTANELLLYDFKYAASSEQDVAYTAQSTTTGGKTTWTPAELAAGDGTITFGSPGKRETTAGKGITLDYTSANFAYRMDGGNTKNALLKPQRPLQEGDVITLHGYSTANVLLSGFSFYAGANDNAYDALLTINWPSSTATEEQEIVYTVKQGDGLAGRSEVYLCRAGKQYTVFLTEVKITGDDASAPVGYERALTCKESVTVTIPDLEADHYVYIKSSAEPSSVPSNLTKITDLDGGTDGYDVATNVYKYKVNVAGNADVTFANGTNIYRIGVTDIMKTMKQVGTGDAWATESRDHAIDYTQTGQFTVNNIKANTVTAKSYTGNKVTVKMNEKTDAMPAETGMVLKLKLAYKEGDPKIGEEGTMSASDATTASSNAATNFAKAKGGNQVPLFYPPYSATILTTAAVGFGGTEGNLMMANLDERVLTQERETGVIDKDGDTMDDSGAADGNFTRFIFADRYMKWTKIDNSVEHTDFINSGNVPVFYRMHLYTSAEAAAMTPATTAETLNTLGANKAYMLIRSGNVPDALWKDQATPARPFIAIEGVSDMEEIINGNSGNDGNHTNNGTYTLSGQRVNDTGNLPPGIYIKNGKKVVIK